MAGREADIIDEILFNNEINIFNVTETIVSRETNAIAVRVPQRSERRHIEKTLGF